MADYGDPTASASTGDPELDAWAADRPNAYVNQLLANGVPPNVIQYMLNQPSYAEGQSPFGGWPYDYAGSEKETGSRLGPQRDKPLNQRQLWQQNPSAGRNISYKPGASAMPGMPWDQQSQMSPQDVQRWQTVMRLLGSRGAGGMVNPAGGGANPMAGLTNQLSQGGGGLMAALVQNPELLRWIMGQQQSGAFPSGGGVDLAPSGVSLAQLLGAPSQAPSGYASLPSIFRPSGLAQQQVAPA